MSDGYYWLDCSIDQIEVYIVANNVLTVRMTDREIINLGVISDRDDYESIPRLVDKKWLTPRKIDWK